MRDRFNGDHISGSERERGRAWIAALREAYPTAGKAQPVVSPEVLAEALPSGPTPACTCWRGKQRSEFLCPTCEDFARKAMARQARMRGLPA